MLTGVLVVDAREVKRCRLMRVKRFRLMMAMPHTQAMDANQESSSSSEQNIFEYQHEYEYTRALYVRGCSYEYRGLIIIPCYTKAHIFVLQNIFFDYSSSNQHSNTWCQVKLATNVISNLENIGDASRGKVKKTLRAKLLHTITNSQLTTQHDQHPKQRNPQTHRPLSPQSCH